MKLFKYLSILLLFPSCGQADCNDVKQAYYPDEYNLIVEESNIDLTWIKIEGHAPVTQEKSSLMVHNNWIVNSSEIEIGDTIVKKSGELIFTIHKPDTIIRHDWYCAGKSYK